MIRYRSSAVEGTVALIVEDEREEAYLFHEGWPQLRIRREQACEKLAGLLGGNDRWDAVPRVAPYSLAGPGRAGTKAALVGIGLFEIAAALLTRTSVAGRADNRAR
jgi:hypothetical protein